MKKIFKLSSCILCLALLFTSLSMVVFAEEVETEETEEPTILLGDVDLSGKVDTVDARLILRLSAKLDPIDEALLERADMNSDGVISVEDSVLALRQATSIVIPDKNGENFLTADPDNEFIQLIANTYNLDPASLVAIYSVPDSGTNYVLRFKKSLIGNRYEKSVDNLYYVYHIGAAPERKISYTNGQLILGDHYNCEPAEGVMVFSLVQSMVMEQYPDYFEGVEKTE